MPITYEVDEARGWVSITATGILTDEEILKFREYLLTDSRFRPSMRVLADVRAIERLDVTAGGVRSMVHHEAAHPGLIGMRRLAIVTESDVVYGMARMYQMLAENNAGVIQLFRDLEGAKGWLESELEDLGRDPGAAEGPVDRARP